MEAKEFFKENPEIAVAFSGGVDSAVLLLLAKRYSKRVKAYFVKSQFQPEFELGDAVIIAKQLGVELEIIEKDILAFEKVCENSRERCYYCKREIMGALCEKAKQDGFSVFCDGTNASDDISDRPGTKALAEYGIKSPLKECGLTKAEIRKIARENNLPVSDKPSYACLATRVPAGTAITKELLEKTELAENALFAFGLKDFRVRYRGGDALLELSKKDFEIFNEKKNDITASLKKYYNGVSVSPDERKSDG
ncbi:MAG: ATP-dependent sacrificial sulfur transferase LarE [Eubacterium sp.]|nr:ATP-dependent sacrificial sulfur transferase LarE [Eubacterium sp.]